MTVIRPPGRLEGAPSGQDELQSFKAQCAQIQQRAAMWAIKLLSDDTIHGFDEVTLMRRLLGEDFEDDPDAPEILPDIRVLEDMLLPSAEDQQLIEYLESRLGLTGDSARWGEWCDLVRGLLEGLEYLSGQLASENPITESDVGVIGDLTGIIDELISRFSIVC